MKLITDAKQRSEKMINVTRKTYCSSRTDTNLETETLFLGPVGQLGYLMANKNLDTSISKNYEDQSLLLNHLTIASDPLICIHGWEIFMFSSSSMWSSQEKRCWLRRCVLLAHWIISANRPITQCKIQSVTPLSENYCCIQLQSIMSRAQQCCLWLIDLNLSLVWLKDNNCKDHHPIDTFNQFKIINHKSDLSQVSSF